MTFQEAVVLELRRARMLHPTPQANMHEGYAVLLEEIDELWDMVRLKGHLREPLLVRAELVQIAAMAQRLFEDVVETGKLRE